MKKISEFGLIKRIVLKLLHRLKKVAIRNDMKGLYDKLFKLHFSLYFDKDLEQEIVDMTEEGRAALRKHGRMVVREVYSNQQLDIKKRLYKASMTAYRDNVILNLKL